MEAKMGLVIIFFPVSPPQVNQFGLYGGFIGNYEEAVEVVRRRCSQADVRFRTLAEVLQPPHTHTRTHLLKSSTLKLTSLLTSVLSRA